MSTALAPLWAISEELQALLESVETCPEELQAELQGRIDLYLGKEAAKTDQIAHVLAALDFEAKCAADEIARLQERRKAAKTAQDRLEAYVCRIIAARGVKQLAGRTNTLSVRRSDAVIITSATDVPTRFLTATVTMPAEDWLSLGGAFQRIGINATLTADKAAIKKALKSGEEISGADLEFRSNLARR